MAGAVIDLPHGVTTPQPTKALAPEGSDAFNAISTRLASTMRPMLAIEPLALRGDLPASAEFRLFANRMRLAQQAWDDYLRADLRAARIQMRYSRASNVFRR
jgi:hypothetical protein